MKNMKNPRNLISNYPLTKKFFRLKPFAQMEIADKMGFGDDLAIMFQIRTKIHNVEKMLAKINRSCAWFTSRIKNISKKIEENKCSGFLYLLHYIAAFALLQKQEIYRNKLATKNEVVKHYFTRRLELSQDLRRLQTKIVSKIEEEVIK